MSPSTASSESEVLFTSLGMFIIDEIHYPPPTPPQFNVAGGAGTYSAVGARLFCPPPLSRGIGCIVDVGDDFPNDVRATLNAWETGCLMRTREGPTTRGWNSFNEDGVRGEFCEFPPLFTARNCDRCNFLNSDRLTKEKLLKIDHRVEEPPIIFRQGDALRVL